MTVAGTVGGSCGGDPAETAADTVPVKVADAADDSAAAVADTAVDDEKSVCGRRFPHGGERFPRRSRARRSDAVCRRFLALPAYERADILLLYAPVRGEVDVWRLFDDALARGKRVGLPRVSGDSSADRGSMEFYEVKSRDFLTPGAYGIPEPDGRCPLLPPGAPAGEGKKQRAETLMAVPGLAFDRLGYRMGYGGGYYDRYLARYRGTAVGITYDHLLRERLPVGRYDLRMDMTVSESECLYFSGNPEKKG